MMRIVEPTDRCDRCRHMMREHASAALGTICMVGRSRSDVANRRPMCPCDGFFVEQPGTP